MDDFFWFCRGCKVWQSALKIIKHGRLKHVIEGADVCE